MTEIAASRKRLTEATSRRTIRQLRVGDEIEVTGTDSAAGQVVAIEEDSEGDPLVILADSLGRRRVITLEFACQRDLTLRTKNDVEVRPDISCHATDVDL